MNIEELRAKLDRNEEERKVLNEFFRAYDALESFYGGNQLSLQVETTRDRGSVGFPTGLRAVLKAADGKPLATTEIWDRMQQFGVRSKSKRPRGLIALNANKYPGEIEKVEPGVYRWIGD